MTQQDLFVATVAVAIGVFTLANAVFNWEWPYQLDRVQQIDSQ